MPEDIQKIAFEATIAPELDSSALGSIRQEIEEGLKKITVPVNPEADKASLAKVAKQISEHVGKTGNTKIRLEYDSKDLKNMDRELRSLSSKYEKAKSLRDSALDPSFAKTFKDNVASITTNASSRTPTGDKKYSDIYRTSREVYEGMHKNSRNAIAVDDFSKNVLAAQFANERISASVSKINRLTSANDWQQSTDSILSVKKELNEIKYYKDFIDNLSIGKGSKGYSQIFDQFQINPDNFGKELKNISLESFDGIFNSLMSDIEGKIELTQSKINAKTKEYNKQWTEAFEKEGIIFDSGDSSVSTKEPEATSITQQQYNGSKRVVEKYQKRVQEGKALSSEDIEDVKKHSRILASGTTDGSHVAELPKKLQDFVSIVEDSEKALSNFKASDSTTPNLGDMKRAQKFLSDFNAKIQMGYKATEEEFASARNALSFVDRYHNSKGQENSNYTHKDLPEISNVRQFVETNKDNYPTPVTIPDRDTNFKVDVQVDTEKINSALDALRQFEEYKNITVEVDFQYNEEKINEVTSRLEELKAEQEKRASERVETTPTESLEEKKDSIKAKIEEPMVLNIDTNNSLDDLGTLESLVTELKAKIEEPISFDSFIDNSLGDLVALEELVLELRSKLGTNANYNPEDIDSSWDKLDVEKISKKMESLSGKVKKYGNDINNTFSGIETSVNKVASAVGSLNQNFNLTSTVVQGLRNINKLFGTGGGTSPTSGNGSASQNPSYSPINAAIRRAESKTIYGSDLGNYTSGFAAEVEDVINTIHDIKDKYDNDKNIAQDEIEQDLSLLNKLNTDLTEYGREKNQYRIRNSKGTVVGENVDTSSFTESMINDMFSKSGTNSKIVETILSNDGLSASVKAKSRTDGKLERYMLNLNPETGIVRQQLKSRSDYGSLFGQIVGDIGKEATKLGKYLVTMGGMDMVWQGFQQGIESIKEMDAAMTELKKVTSETDDVYSKVKTNMFATGKEIGRSAVELTKSTADWARLGYDTQSAEELSKWTGILMNVSEFEQVDDATNSLISIMQGFNKGADEVQNIVDVLNNIGNLEPISSDEIASSLQRSASALQAGGNSYEESVALTTVANSVVQDPASVGAGLKTVSLRLRGTDTETLQAAGEDTDGVVESVSQLRQLLMDLTKVSSNNYKGFDLLKADGSYKNTYDTLLGLGEIWEEIGSQEGGDLKQASILEKIAGKNRANIVASILQKPDMLKKVYGETQNSDGSALKENETYLDSIQGKVDRLTVSFQEMWNNTISSDTIKNLVDVGTVLTEIVDKVGLLNVGIAGAAGFAGIKGEMGLAHYNDETKSVEFPIGNALMSAFSPKRRENLYTDMKSDQQVLKDIFDNVMVSGFNRGRSIQEVQEDFFKNRDNLKTEKGKDTFDSIAATAKSNNFDFSNDIQKKKDYGKSLEDFDKAVDRAGSASKSAAGGIASAFESIASSGLAAKAGVFALNAGLGILAGALVELGGKAISYVADKIKKAATYDKDKIEKADKTRSNYQDKVTNINSNLSTLNSSKAEFEALAGGVDEYGNNISLDTSSYERFLSIRKEILDTTPSLISGYNAEGNAIAKTSGLIDKAIESQEKKLQTTEKKYNSDQTWNELIEGNNESLKKASGTFADKYIFHNDIGTARGEIKQAINNNTQNGFKEAFDNAVKETLGKDSSIDLDKDSDISRLANNYSKIFAQMKKDNPNLNIEGIENNLKESLSTYADRYKEIADVAKQYKEDFQRSVTATQGYDGLSSEGQSFLYGIAGNIIDFSNANEEDLTEEKMNEKRKELLGISEKFADSDKLQGNLKDLLETSGNADGDKAVEWSKKVQDAYSTLQKSLGKKVDGKTLQEALGDAFNIEFDGKGNILHDGQNVEAMIEKIKEKLGDTKDVTSFVNSLDFSDMSQAFDILNSKTEIFTGTVDQLKERIRLLNQTKSQSSWSDYLQATETADAGATYLGMREAFNNQKKQRDLGLVGTDDFKTLTSVMSASGKSDVATFDKTWAQTTQYFTEDKSGLVKFLDDLSEKSQKADSNFGKLKKTADGHWSGQITNTASAAKSMGMGIEAFEAVLNRLKDYGGEIKFDSVVEQYEAAEESVNQLASKWAEMEDGAGKTELGKEIEEYRQQIIKLKDAGEDIPDEMIKKIKFEIEVADEKVNYQNQQSKLQGALDSNDKKLVNGYADSYSEKAFEYGNSIITGAESAADANGYTVNDNDAYEKWKNKSYSIVESKRTAVDKAKETFNTAYDNWDNTKEGQDKENAKKKLDDAKEKYSKRIKELQETLSTLEEETASMASGEDSNGVFRKKISTKEQLNTQLDKLKKGLKVNENNEVELTGDKEVDEAANNLVNEYQDNKKEGSVNIKVNADTAEAEKKIDDVKDEGNEPTSVEVDANTKKAIKKIANFMDIPLDKEGNLDLSTADARQKVEKYLGLKVDKTGHLKGDISDAVEKAKEWKEQHTSKTASLKADTSSADTTVSKWAENPVVRFVDFVARHLPSFGGNQAHGTANAHGTLSPLQSDALAQGSVRKLGSRALATGTTKISDFPQIDPIIQTEKNKYVQDKTNRMKSSIAHSGGDWGLKQNEKALTGELGEELVV